MDIQRMLDICLHNNLKGITYRITYTNGSTETGVPTVGSFVMPTPDATFSLKIGGVVKQVKFGEVSSIDKP